MVQHFAFCLLLLNKIVQKRELIYVSILRPNNNERELVKTDQYHGMFINVFSYSRFENTFESPILLYKLAVKTNQQLTLLLMYTYNKLL